MNKELQRDINYVNSIINGKNKEFFSKVFTQTNEPLDLIFDKIDLTGKKIYTVLSSSDYLYMSYLHNATDIDCFDINPITYRYYFLRKWLIDNDILSLYSTNLEEVLDIVKNRVNSDDMNENDTIDFWKFALAKMKDKKLYTNMFHNFFNNLLWLSQYNPFNNYYNDKIDQLKTLLDTNKINFSRVDICNPSFDIEQNYDYIFLSNILDYHRFNKKDLLTIKKYLLSILNNKGKVICLHIDSLSNELEFDNIIQRERRVFQDDFEYSFIETDDYGTNYYYQYLKK